jgi:hypothetical protein
MVHKALAEGRWLEFSFLGQMANIGCDVDRAIRWRKKDNQLYSNDALKRALELLTLSIGDPKNKKRLKEIGRIKEVLLDYFMGDNSYGYTDEALQKYFLDYNYMAALERGL